ncbi:DnaJ domain-containing protein [Vibrio sp. SCSIO 43136]|uniref:DnaJ domain-containing protein n=1 Tax=Vibrio sp. SCSIO 43136 TaxID=2819101 RepID=UPI002075CFA9|nr:DnaJ domain-containing protein [Vibrio sp. SCSIO 43136]USD64128.1 SEL1-like repeat protein [Vibrio sp. SCSIO 43136]
MINFRAIFAPLIFSVCVGFSFNAISASIDELTALADKQDPIAQYSLSQAFFSGNGVAKDSQRAVEWLKLSAQNGYSLAQLKLGSAYDSGIAIEGNVDRAIYWYTKAATQGLARAQYKLGVLYENEFEETSQLNDLKLAQTWFKVAQENNSEQAQDALYRVQELLFNARRAEQLGQFKQLDTNFESEQSRLEDPQAPPVPAQPQVLNWQTYLNHPYLPYALGAIAALLVLITLIAALKRSKNKQGEKQQQAMAKAQGDATKLRKELEKAHKQLLSQNVQIQKFKNDQQNQSIALACAFLGFNPNKLPTDDVIKQRYKKLSRVYHPDTNGSQEDMKKLNAALKIVVAQRKKSVTNN